MLERLRADLPHLQLFQGYGMTESAALVSCLLPEDHAREDKLASAGRPGAGHRRVRSGPRTTRSSAAGEVGEVCVRGGQFMREYWRRPEETAEAFRGGWYRSGDAGYLDAEGFLFLVDRTKDMIVSGGENVYSTEVEQAVAAHPAVAQVAVIGVPHDLYGEAVHAVVVLKPGAHGHRAGADRPRQGPDRRLQGAEVGVVPRRAAAAVGRDEGAQARAAGAVLGGPRARGQLTGRGAGASAGDAAPASSRSGTGRATRSASDVVDWSCSHDAVRAGGGRDALDLARVACCRGARYAPASAIRLVTGADAAAGHSPRVLGERTASTRLVQSLLAFLQRGLRAVRRLRPRPRRRGDEPAGPAHGALRAAR